MTCSECGIPLHVRNTTGTCRRCYNRLRMAKRQARYCGDCGGKTGPGARRDLCRVCYDRHRRAGTLPEIQTQELVRPVRACSRCGITTTARRGICRDCRDVLSAEEIGRWAS